MHVALRPAAPRSPALTPLAGACRSIRGMLSSMQAQVGAAEVQIVALGFASSRSSRVPLRTKIRCGRTSASLNILRATLRAESSVASRCRYLRSANSR